MANSGMSLAVVIQYLIGTIRESGFPLRFSGRRQQQQHNHKLWNFFVQNLDIWKVKRMQLIFIYSVFHYYKLVN
jgi:hypothetical protein